MISTEDMNTFWPREYEKEGITYVLDVSSHRGPWIIYNKKTHEHITYGPNPEVALRNAGLTIFDRVKKENL